MSGTAPPAVAPAQRGLRRPMPSAGRRPWAIGAFVLALLAVSAIIRTRAIGAPLWADEGIAEGIASHSLGGVLEAMRQDGSPPLYYLLLHVWMRLFGDAEASLHALSLVFALAFVPVALWAGWALFGRRAGLVAATLAACNPYLTAYAHEARMYTLLSLLGLVAATTFVLAFVRRDRRAVAAFGVTLTLMLYTHNWSLFFAAAAAGAVLVLARRAPDRRALLRDGALAFGGAAVLYLPWLPTLIGQAGDTGAPWASPPTVAAAVQVVVGVSGGAAAAVALLAAVGIGIGPLARAPDRARAVVVLAGLAAGTLALAWIASQVSPAWSTRYFGTVLGAALLVPAAAIASAGRLGLAALALVVALSIPVPTATSLSNKSNADVIAGELAPLLRPGDVVLSIQPEQVPLLRYYLPPGLRYADPRGPVADPRVMDWRNALEDMRASRPDGALPESAGGRVLYVAPVTDQREDWRAPWTSLVRRRAAQWGDLLERTPELRPVAAAPAFYREARNIGLRAVLYEVTPRRRR
jgi:mannosyltransferase